MRQILQEWDALDGAPEDLRWLERTLRDCGLDAAAFAIQARLAATADGAAQESLIRSLVRTGDPWWARVLLDQTPAATRELQALRIDVAVAIGDAFDLIATWCREHRDTAARDAAMSWLVRVGRVDAAERLLEETQDLPLWRARLALWRNQPERAGAALAGLERTPAVCCLEAIAAVLQGRLAYAEALLRALLDSEVRSEAWAWLATVLRRQARYAEAVQAADAANAASPVFNLPARLERELADARSRYSPSRVARLLHAVGLADWWTRGATRARRVGDLEHAAALACLGARPEDSIETLETVLDRLAGNRTPYVTMMDGGALRSVVLPLDPRELGAGLRSVLWTRGVAAVRDLYRELAPRVGGQPLFRIYEGELELWLGAYDDAADIFREALTRDRLVRWAWIGLGASAMLRGRLEEAQTIWAEGLATAGAGPTLYAYRGECYRRQGESAKARADLELALQQKPERISARINLALLSGESLELEQALRDCVALAPLLMEELDGPPAARLEKILEAMRGNRSSSPALVTYHLWGRLWRRATHGAAR